MGGEFKCSMEKCNWTGQSEEERSVHQRLCHDMVLKRKLPMEEVEYSLVVYDKAIVGRSAACGTS